MTSMAEQMRPHRTAMYHLRLCTGAETMQQFAPLKSFLSTVRVRVGKTARSGYIAFFSVIVMLGTARAKEAQPPGELLSSYSTHIRPLLERFCLECHSTEKMEGQLDLEHFTTIDHVRADLDAWEVVVEMLDGGEMPPKEGQQPSVEQREQLVAWVTELLESEARANAGDPGRVVLRRLSNAEYDYTLRDLTGIDLRPARQFPIDGAAGEGFTNTGASLVMSPVLVDKYYDAAKNIAAHAVLLPDGVRFSPSTSRRDWTEEARATIRAFHARYVGRNGRVPLERYVKASLAYRDEILAGTVTIAKVADHEGLSAKYLQTLWDVMNHRGRSQLLDPIRALWLTTSPDDTSAVVAEIERWSNLLWDFKQVSHTSKWQQPNDPLPEAASFEHSLTVPSDQRDVTLFLVARDAGDGNQGDYVVWQRPRIEGKDVEPILLRDVSLGDTESTRANLAKTAQYLAAAAEANATDGNPDRVQSDDKEPLRGVDNDTLAKKYDLDAGVLRRWITYLGLECGEFNIRGHLSSKLTHLEGNAALKGWGFKATPYIVVNSSDERIRDPFPVAPHKVVVHPSSTHAAAVGWVSPIEGTVRIEGKVDDVRGLCGNGIVWTVRHRRGAAVRELTSGIFDAFQRLNFGPFESVLVKPGDLISVAIASREHDHHCDLTRVDLVIKEVSRDQRVWELGADMSADVHAGNPHADRLGNEGVWHFYSGKDDEMMSLPRGIPANSVLAKWRAALADRKTPSELDVLADAVEKLLTSPPPIAKDDPDSVLYRQLTSRPDMFSAGFGLDPSLFGRHPLGQPVDAASLVVLAPSVLEIRLPAELAGGRDFIVTGKLDPTSGTEGSVQLELLSGRPEKLSSYRPNLSIITMPERGARMQLHSSYAKFREVFPASMCYTRIVPTDDIVTIILHHREDEHLRRLMLDDEEAKEIDRLWSELRYVSQDALEVQRAFEFVAQGGGPKDKVAPARKPVEKRAEEFQRELIAAEPKHLQWLLEFASRAYRRPLEQDEQEELLAHYRSIRQQEQSHEDAFRSTLAALLVSPNFLYKVEQPLPGTEPQPVTDLELATRISYFLWSTMPDDQLRRAAEEGRLRDPETLVRQTRRMLKDPRVRGLAIEFGAQWLDVRGFDEFIEKNEKIFPTFDETLKKAIYEETILFFEDLVRSERSVLEILEADHTFLNETLARHYGIPGVEGDDWRRVDGVRDYGHGGILGMASVLAKQSGASRTSPVLRGNFIFETLLGGHLPNPPPKVPQLPEDERETNGLTVRQLVEKHRSAVRCAVCHDKIDPLGLPLEEFDPLGRRRTEDLAGRAVDTRVIFQEEDFEGLAGLRLYLLAQRRDEFLRQFSRKLLGYALGRGVTLSDMPLVETMVANLERDDFRFSSLVMTIAASKQFQYHRGLDASTEDES